MERGRTLHVFAPSAVTRRRRDSLITGGLFLLVKVGLITLALKKQGIPSNAVFSLLLLTLIGSAINIPIKCIPGERASAGQVVEFFGWRFRIAFLISTDFDISGQTFSYSS